MGQSDAVCASGNVGTARARGGRAGRRTTGATSCFPIRTRSFWREDFSFPLLSRLTRDAFFRTIPRDAWPPCALMQATSQRASQCARDIGLTGCAPVVWSGEFVDSWGFSAVEVCQCAFLSAPCYLRCSRLCPPPPLRQAPRLRSCVFLAFPRPRERGDPAAQRFIVWRERPELIRHAHASAFQCCHRCGGTLTASGACSAQPPINRSSLLGTAR